MRVKLIFNLSPNDARIAGIEPHKAKADSVHEVKDEAARGLLEKHWATSDVEAKPPGPAPAPAPSPVHPPNPVHSPNPEVKAVPPMPVKTSAAKDLGDRT